MHELATSYAVHKNKAKQEILPRIIYRKDFVACSPLPTADAKCQVDIAKTPMCRSPRQFKFLCLAKDAPERECIIG